MDAPDPESDRESESRWGGRGGDREAEPGLVIWGVRKRDLDTLSHSTGPRAWSVGVTLRMTAGHPRAQGYFAFLSAGKLSGWEQDPGQHERCL